MKPSSLLFFSFEKTSLFFSGWRSFRGFGEKANLSETNGGGESAVVLGVCTSFRDGSHGRSRLSFGILTLLTDSFKYSIRDFGFPREEREREREKEREILGSLGLILVSYYSCRFIGCTNWLLKSQPSVERLIRISIDINIFSFFW